jgi:DNA topoisomerase-1
MKWTRKGRKGAFTYYDQAGKKITDQAKVERIEKLAIPPAWRNVEISPSARAKLQATGYDKAGRKQYLYHADFRAAQEQAKYDKLIRFAEKLPDLRATLAATGSRRSRCASSTSAGSASATSATRRSRAPTA